MAKELKKFDFVIGNPPYQDQTIGENDKFAPSVFNIFMDSAYQIANKVEMITPAKFLFNAGNTPKKWNAERLNDEHFKVQKYYADSKDVFQGVNISGGVAIHYRDNDKNFGSIGIFINDDTMRRIQNKVSTSSAFKSFSEIVITRTAYRLTDTFHEDFPKAINDLSNGHKYDMSTNIFDRIPYAFCDSIKDEYKNDYYKILGRQNNQRLYKYILKKYVRETINTKFYKVVIPKAWDCQMMPIIQEPFCATTETFITVGTFENRKECENCLKYIRTKFARILLMILKTTQDLSPEKWKFVPLQDFTDKSDIDWSKPIKEIDQQLYKKYGLSEDEIKFIEEKVKEMN